MTKSGVTSFGVWCVVMLVVVLVAEVHETAAVSCNPLELSPCIPAITGSQDPSTQCCTKLKEQVPCFCQYMNNPTFKPYIDSPNTKKVAGICGVSPPTC